MTTRPPLPPFTEQTARQKVQAAEDAWNTRDPERVAGAAPKPSAASPSPRASAGYSPRLRSARVSPASGR